MPYSSSTQSQQSVACSSEPTCGHVADVRAIIRCTRCEHTFAARRSRYYWCRCGEPLTDGDELSPPVAVPAGAPARSRRFPPSARASAVVAPGPITIKVVHAS